MSPPLAQSLRITAVYPRLEHLGEAPKARPPLGVSAALIVLVLLCSFARADQHTGEQNNWHAKLLGDWSGSAVVTPIGPHPYDIEFKREADGSVYGVADPGGSLHHWRFLNRGNETEVRFLTTFRNNTKPIILKVEAESADAVSLRAISPNYLRVDISMAEDSVDIRIFLHKAPHVEIELKRRMSDAGS